MDVSSVLLSMSIGDSPKKSTSRYRTRIISSISSSEVPVCVYLRGSTLSVAFGVIGRDIDASDTTADLYSVSALKWKGSFVPLEKVNFWLRVLSVLSRERQSTVATELIEYCVEVGWAEILEDALGTAKPAPVKTRQMNLAEQKEG